MRNILRKITVVVMLMACATIFNNEQLFASTQKSGSVPGYITSQSQFYGGNSAESYGAMEATDDGGLIVVGTTESSASGDISEVNPANSGGWIVKLDENGNIEWEHVFSYGAYSTIPKDVIVTDNGHYFVVGNALETGSKGPENFIAEFNQDGDVLRGGTLSSATTKQSLEKVIETENYYVAFGYAEGKDIYGYPLEKRAIEVYRYEKTFSETDNEPRKYKLIDGNYDEQIVDTILLENGNIGVVGYSSSTNGVFSNNYGSSDFFFLEMTEDLNIVANKVYGSSSEDRPSGVSINDDGNLYIYMGLLEKQMN